MNEQDFYPESSRSLDSLRHMRLMALLRDMIEAEGKVQTAAALGVNYRTLVRHEETGRLTDRMADALERHLLLGGGSAAAQQRDRVDALVERVSALERELRGGLEAIVGEVKAFREEHARSMRHVERRLVQSETGQDARDGAKAALAAVKQPVVKPAWRLHRELVTQEPGPGEEQVYGDAMPVIVEWRQARAEYAGAKNRLDKAVARRRVLELEIAIIEEHELTLPRRLRLSEFLRDLVRQEGKMEAAELLGVNHKTLTRAEESGEITGRMGDALELLLRRADDAEVARLREAVGALEERVAALEGGMETPPAADVEGGGESSQVEGGDEDGTQAQAQGGKHEEGAGRSETRAAPRVAGLRSKKRATLRRLDPEVVTEEPAADDAEVYGDAWPLVEEWRRLRAGHPH